MSRATAVVPTTVVLPPAGIYEADPQHSSVGFTARHLMVAKTRGRFSDFSATITVAEDPAGSSATASIQAGSITTASEQRDEHLRSADFFDADRFPTLSFRSSAFEQTGDGAFNLHGELEIRGIAKPVVLEAEYLGVFTDPRGNTRIAFEAETTLDREEWGMTWNQALETGGVLVGKKVDVRLEIEAVLQG